MRCQEIAEDVDAGETNPCTVSALYSVVLCASTGCSAALHGIQGPPNWKGSSMSAGIVPALSAAKCKISAAKCMTT